MTDDYEIWLKSARQRLAAAVVRAGPLLGAGRYDEAERIVNEGDGSIYSAIAVAQMYTAYLRRRVEQGGVQSDRRGMEEIFRRALQWKTSAYPEPHTQIETDDYARGRAEDLAELVKILGYDPAAK